MPPTLTAGIVEIGKRVSEDDAVLSFHSVSKRFESGKRRIEALHEISLRLRRGSITGLIGPDGAGKTTLMRLAAGLLPPDSGQGDVLGMDMRGGSRAVMLRRIRQEVLDLVQGKKLKL